MKEEPLTKLLRPSGRRKARVNEPVQRALDCRKTFNSLPSPAKRVETARLVGVNPNAPTLITGDIKLVDGRPIQGGRRGGLTAQQKYERWMARLAANPAKAKAYYLRHREAIDSVRVAKPNEVFENTPVERGEVPDPMAVYDHTMKVWYESCRRHRKLMLKATGMMKGKRFSVKRLREFCAKHPDVFDGLSPRATPVQPEMPEVERVTAPKLDGRTGIRKEAAAKARALTSIDKRMAEEQRKTRAAKVETPAPVMRHHDAPNPWLNR